MKQDITRDVQICPTCHCAFDPELGDICQCQQEEPLLQDWKGLGDCDED